MEIIPHPQKAGVRVLRIITGNTITPEAIIEAARRSGIIDEPARGEDALIWIQFADALPVSYKVGYLWKNSEQGVIITAEKGIHFREESNCPCCD